MVSYRRTDDRKCLLKELCTKYCLIKCLLIQFQFGHFVHKLVSIFVIVLLTTHRTFLKLVFTLSDWNDEL